MRYLVEFRLPSDLSTESIPKERECLQEGSMEDQEDIQEESPSQEEGEVINKYLYEECCFVHCFI